MSKKRRRVYFDRKAEIARVEVGEEGAEVSGDGGWVVAREWNRSSRQTWHEFITTWESRFLD